MMPMMVPVMISSSCPINLQTRCSIQALMSSTSTFQWRTNYLGEVYFDIILIRPIAILQHFLRLISKTSVLLMVSPPNHLNIINIQTTSPTTNYPYHFTPNQIQPPLQSIQIIIINLKQTLQSQYLLTMGICQNIRKQRQNNKANSKIFTLQQYNNISFHFTTSNLLRLTSKCLVLFTNQKLKLEKDPFLKKAGTLETIKVSEFAQSYLTNNKQTFSHGKIIFFPIKIESLRFESVALIGLGIAKKQQDLKPNIEQILQNLLMGFIQRQIDDITITEFNDEFGIDVDKGSKLLARVVKKYKQKIKTMTVLCDNNDSMKLYREAFTGVDVEVVRQTALSVYY